MINTKQTDLAAVMKIGDDVRVFGVWYLARFFLNVYFLQVKKAINQLYRKVEIDIDGVFKV